MKTKYSIWLVIIALASMLWLPNLFTYGMFMDGVINASVAKLYAEGTGTFFNLQERYYVNGVYMGHPPLVFVIQGWFFKIFGSAFFMDKLYSLICALIQLLLIRTLWLRVVTTDELKKLSWLPCLLWLISPIISWGYSSNLLENTMSLFTTAALIVILKYIGNRKHVLLYSAGAALLTFAALLCKGPVALFVLVAPVVFVNLYAAYTFRKAFVHTALISVFLLALCSVVLLLPDSWQFVVGYLNEQLKPSLNTDGFSIARTAILLHLLKALSAPLILAVLVYMLGRRLSFRKTIATLENGNVIGIRFLLLGLCATLPIMLSNKQSAFYTIPAMPVFALAFALLIVAPVRILCERFMKGRLRIGIAALSVICIVAMSALSYTNAGTTIRDKDMLHDIAEINKMMHGEKVVWDAENDYSQQYIFKAYLSRLYGKEVYYNRPSSWRILKEPELMFCAKEYEYKGKMVNLYFSPPLPPPDYLERKENKATH